MRKKQALKFASPIQTKRWLKCITDWAKIKNKTQTDVCNLIGFSNRSSLHRLSSGAIKRVKMEVIERTAKEAGLDINYINGLFDFKSKFSEARNIFSEFKETYYELYTEGNLYAASQIVRKAALFIFETLLPKDLHIALTLENKHGLYDKAQILCCPDNVQYFVVNLHGGQKCVQFTLSKRVNGLDLPIMEGDLDIHAVSSIKKYFNDNKKKSIKSKNAVDKFDTHAKKLVTASLNKI